MSILSIKNTTVVGVANDILVTGMFDIVEWGGVVFSKLRWLIFKKGGAVQKNVHFSLILKLLLWVENDHARE
jgi:hypothetical protein